MYVKFLCCTEVTDVLKSQTWSPRYVPCWSQRPSKSKMPRIYGLYLQVVCISLKSYSHISCSLNRKSGSVISNMWEKFAHTHRSCDMAHAPCLQTHSQWYPMGNIRTHTAQKCLMNWIRWTGHCSTFTSKCTHVVRHHLFQIPQIEDGWCYVFNTRCTP